MFNLHFICQPTLGKLRGPTGTDLYRFDWYNVFFLFFFVEIQDDGNSLALLYHTISELPQPNRDTLACLMIHLQK